MTTPGDESPEVVVHEASPLSAGFVRFPTGSPRYLDTREGGMFVRLVVEDREGPPDRSNSWMRCPGGGCVVIYDATFLRDNVRPPPQLIGAGLSSFTYLDAAYDLYRERDFPRLSEEAMTVEKFVSIPYLACITLGSTRWTGYDEAARDFWHCTEADLTDEGRNLLAMVKSLYPGCRVRLQTWLKT